MTTPSADGWIHEADDVDADEPTTWEPIDLGPYLAGKRSSPRPTVGIARTDGQKLIYPGREHTVFGETEAGKSWFALECAAAEMRMGRSVLYLHYEEGDEESTVERLLLLCVSAADIQKHLRFVAPAQAAKAGCLEALLDPPPVLVIHDGVNEAMSLHADKIMDPDGAATFRRRLIKPCLRVGAATLACDHVTKNSDGARGRYAIGSGHKINAIDGAAFLMENIEPFGRGLRGASSVYIAKDRPGQLRVHGKPTKVAGKTLIGVLVVDASPDAGPDFLTLYPPKDGDSEQAGSQGDEVADIVLEVISGLPERTVGNTRALFAAIRNAGHHVRDSKVRDALADLVFAGRLEEIPGKRSATAYKVALTASQETPQ